MFNINCLKRVNTSPGVIELWSVSLLHHKMMMLSPALSKRNFCTCYLIFISPSFKVQPRRKESLLTCLADLFNSIATQKKKVGVIPPKKFISRLRKENGDSLPPLPSVFIETTSHWQFHWMSALAIMGWKALITLSITAFPWPLELHITHPELFTWPWMVYWPNLVTFPPN